MIFLVSMKSLFLLVPGRGGTDLEGRGGRGAGGDLNRLGGPYRASAAGTF